MIPVTSSTCETQNQLGQVEVGCLDERLLEECASLPGNLFTIVTSLEGVVANSNEAMSILSLLKV